MTNNAVEPNSSVKGWTWGRCELTDASLDLIDAEGRKVFSVAPGDVSQATIQGRSDLALEFMPEAAEKEDECLAELRFFVPNDDLLNHLKEEISKKGSGGVGGEKICSLSEVPLVLPRGHFDFDFYSSSLKMRGKSFDYAIKYSNINRAFVLMKPDGVHVAFVLGLDKPVRQGNTAYSFLCLQFDMQREEADLEVRLPDESQYAESGLEKNESGKPLADVLQRLLKYFAKVNVQFACLDFKSTNGKNCVRCSHRATEGHLYCLKRAFIFVTKPVVYVRYEDVVAVEFSRAESWMTQTRFFDLKVYKKGETQPYDFQQIDRNEYQPLIDFMQNANIRIRNLEKSQPEQPAEATLLGEDFDDEDEDSEFSEEDGSDDSDDDSDESEDGSEDEEEEDRKRKKKHRSEDEKNDESDNEERKKKKKHRSEDEKNDESDDEERKKKKKKHRSDEDREKHRSEKKKKHRSERSEKKKRKDRD